MASNPQQQNISRGLGGGNIGQATSPPAAADKFVKVDLHNDSPAHRVIYDGAQHRTQRSFMIKSGETKQNVELHETIIKELRDTYKDSPKGKRLRVLPAGSTKPSEPEPAKTTATGDDDADDGE